MINKNREYCYRLTHRDNLEHHLRVGICTRHHPDADPGFVSIGHPDIIASRDTEKVRLRGYGYLGEYVPFYFTPKSIMQFNIVTGYWHPVVQQRHPSELVVLRCRIVDLNECDRYFFTDGQANNALTNHYRNLVDLDAVDWPCIHAGNFSKSGDADRARRYQAEFLVHHHVPVDRIESIHVYDQAARQRVLKTLVKTGHTHIPVYITKQYYF